MVKAVARGVELEPIDRLEEKMKRLVGMVERMRAEQAQSAAEHERLTREIDALRGRLTASEAMSSELTALKEEREVIRGRVGDMLDQLEALNI